LPTYYSIIAALLDLVNVRTTSRRLGCRRVVSARDDTTSPRSRSRRRSRWCPASWSRPPRRAPRPS